MAGDSCFEKWCIQIVIVVGEGTRTDILKQSLVTTQTPLASKSACRCTRGGGVSASTRQASRNLEQAEYELEGKTRKTLIQLRRQFNDCLSGVSKLRAYQKALRSAEALVVSTQQSVLGGERVNLDVLNAEQQLYTTRRDWARARYDYLMAWTQLHYYAGILKADELASVDAAFSGGTVSQ